MKTKYELYIESPYRVLWEREKNLDILKSAVRSDPDWEELYAEQLELARANGHNPFYAVALAHKNTNSFFVEHHKLLQQLIDLHVAGKTNAKQEAYLEKEILEGNIVA